MGGATSEVNALREALNNGQTYIDKMTDIHSVCGVVKYWFRVLPETVIPEALFDTAVDAASASVHYFPWAQTDVCCRTARP